MIPTSENDRKVQEKSPFSAGKRWKWKQYFEPENQGIFSVNSGRFPLEEQEFDWKTPVKSEVFPTQSTASMKSSNFHATDRFLVVLTDLGWASFTLFKFNNALLKQKA